MKPPVWIGSSRKDLKEFPDEVRSDVGHALYPAQQGERAGNAKPLRGFKGAGVLEIIEDFDGSTYRAVYTVKLAGRVYVLHAFQKKSRRSVATPKEDIELARSRLKVAEDLHAAWETDTSASD